jgi:prepilin-type N-terminal cleavage/methylation domain-containing protein
MNIKNIKTTGGFTLIEMIVSLAIFTIVAVVAVGALIKILDANKKAINLKTVTNSLNFALESMTREMRVGSKYYISSNSNAAIPSSYTPTNQKQSIDSGSWVIAFTSSKPDSTKNCNLIFAYRYHNVSTGNNPDDWRLQKAQQSTCSDTINSGNVGYTDIVTPDIRFTKVTATVDASRVTPQVELFFQGNSGTKDKLKVEFAIQTKISQRIK